MTDQWESAVTVKVAGVVRTVANTMDAADCLFNHHSETHGPQFDQAMQSFADVFDGREPPETARAAFLQAMGDVDSPDG